MSSTLSGSGLRWWIWLSAGVSLVAVLAGGWLTPARGWLHSLFIRSGAEWFGPLVIGLCLGVLFPVAITAVVLRTDNFAGRDWHTNGLKSMLRAALEAGWRKDCDHPQHQSWRSHSQEGVGWPMCGLGAGAALGVAALVLVLAGQVVPLELDTLGVLLSAEARLDGGAAPVLQRRPTGESTLLASDGARGEPLLDAFGNAITYEGAEAGAGVAYTLRSLGSDGIWSSDDLCVHGQTQNLPVEGRLVDASQFQRSLQTDRVGWPERLAVLRQTRCTTSRHFIASAGHVRAE
jgi:hypothetical protein